MDTMFGVTTKKSLQPENAQYRDLQVDVFRASGDLWITSKSRTALV
jgi:hypothetical protein